MDNMGEAADLHRGLHDPSVAIGHHHSVTTQLPRLLSALKSRSIHATYFIEGWNNTHYSDTIRSVAAAGHEIGFHAWQHEVWKNLDAATEVANLDRSVRDAERWAGVQYRGFRPPGGGVTERTLGLLKDRGFTYISPAAERCAVVDGVAVVPFQWRSIDAYFYIEATGVLREARGDGKGIMSPTQMRDRLLRRVDECLEEGGYLALLFHPFLTESEERHKVVEAVLDHVKKREKDGLWIAKCDEVADWVLRHPEQFGDDPGWDTAEWKKK
ncbi:hypothetical protein ANO11243_036070 [Dothideomycetidae sp. 11243]|nr:hypothetical protein ANO11243_036070 [fungal sp. No.11243]